MLSLIAEHTCASICQHLPVTRVPGFVARVVLGRVAAAERAACNISFCSDTRAGTERGDHRVHFTIELST